MNRSTYPASQELPSLFLDSCFNGNRHVYLTSNRRYRFKTELVVPKTGPIRITGDRWVQFCLENMVKAVLLHFVEQGDDTFYVTGYDNDGLECGGYNEVRKRPERIVTRVWPYQDYPQMLPTEFLSGLNQNALLSISANKINYDVHVQRVEIGDSTGVFKYQLNEDDWNALVEAATITKFDGFTNLKKRQRELTFDEKDDDRMEHICLWPGHTEHFGERNDAFYKRFSSTLDKQRLPISAKLMKKHPFMHLYRKALIRHQKIEFEMRIKMDRHLENPTRTNHVNIHGKWRQFGKACRFDYNKMMRVKYLYTVQVLEDDNQERIPVFNVC
ncbi:hypothetical protein Tco_0091226 [Tanacetum coccineum]